MLTAVRISLALASVSFACCALAQQDPEPQTARGISQPVYTGSVIEAYRVETPYGVIYGEVKRPVVPKGVLVPVILTYSPYNILGSPANQAGSIADDSVAGYFVPRGYARAVFDVVGTRESSGCYDYGGLGERETGAAVIEFLGTRAWSSGKVGMIGGSYDGTTQWAAAVQQPAHLTTLIPQVAIDRWYDYAYGGGIRYFMNSEAPTDEGFDTPLGFDFGFGFLLPLDITGSQFVDALSTRINPCARIEHTQRGYDPNPVYDDFWMERDYRHLADKIKASVLIEGGWLDHNVKHWDSTRMFQSLPATLPKRMVIGQWNHSSSQFTDAQDIRHAWFDYWLLGLDTGVMKLPAIDSEANDGVRRQDKTWPPPGTKNVAFSLDGAAAPALTLRNSLAAAFIDDPLLTEEQIFGNAGCNSACLMFTSEPLPATLRISGSPQLHLQGSIDADGTHYTPVLYDEAADGTSKIITRGFLNLRNRRGLEFSEPVSGGEIWDATVDLWDTDYVLAKGHRLGLALMSSNAVWALPDATAATTTLELKASKLDVPLSRGADTISVKPPASRAAPTGGKFGGAIGTGLLLFGLAALRRRALIRRTDDRLH